MKPTLFVAPGACSFACHVVVEEAGLPIEVVPVDLRDPAAPHRAFNPLGRVPTLVTADREVLTESVALLPHLADMACPSGLLAPVGTVARARTMAWVAYLGAEIHAACFRTINRPQMYCADVSAHAGVRAAGFRRLQVALAPIEAALRQTSGLVGDHFTIADAYLGVFAGWVQALGDEVEPFPTLARFGNAYERRPSVSAARAREAASIHGLLLPGGGVHPQR